MKLYWNSYNITSEIEEQLLNAIDKDSITTRNILDAIEQLSAKHLSVIVDAPVTVKLVTHQDLITDIELHGGDFLATPTYEFCCIDDVNIECTTYKEDPSVLSNNVDFEIADNATHVRFMTTLLRSNCRVTNQPDWGFLYLVIDKTAKISLDSIIKYVVSLRNNNCFHEEIAEKVFKRISDYIGNDKQLGVGITYSRRGGWDINPIRVSHINLLNEFAWIDGYSRTTIQ